MMMEKCTRWETSGRRSILVPSVPVLAMADSRCVTGCSFFLVLVLLQPYVFRCVIVILFFSQNQGWRCENCRRPGGQADVNADVLHPGPSDAFDKYRENALRKLVSSQKRLNHRSLLRNCFYPQCSSLLTSFHLCFPEHPVSNRVFEAGAASRCFRHLGLKKNLNNKEGRSEISHSAATSEEDLTTLHLQGLSPHQLCALTNIQYVKNNFCSQLEMFFPGDYFLITVRAQGLLLFTLNVPPSHTTCIFVVFPVGALWLSVKHSILLCCTKHMTSWFSDFV